MMDKVSHLDQVAYIRRVKTHDGINLLLCKYKKLEFALLEDQAMDIFNLSFCGDNISFISKNGLTAQNMSVDFDKRFVGGFLFTCGLENIGRSNDKTTHGSLCFSKVAVSKIQADENGLEIECSIRQTALFGDNFLLLRRYRITENTIELFDEIKNDGYNVSGYMLLYHINFGYPFLDKDTVVGDIHVMNEPKPQNIEQVSFYKKQQIVLKNKNIKKQIEIYHDMPYVATWISEVSGDYGLGIEPASCTFLEKKHTQIAAKCSDRHYTKIIFKEI